MDNITKGFVIAACSVVIVNGVWRDGRHKSSQALQACIARTACEGVSVPSDWSSVPAGKKLYDRLTCGGVTKFWHNGYLFGVVGGSWQTAASLNDERKRHGVPPRDFSKIGLSRFSQSER
jgi:hypothetical protein